MRFNYLRELPADVWATLFSGLSNLQVLELSGNQLSDLPAEVFHALTNLQTLYLHGNKLSELPAEVWANWFAGLGNLQTLNLQSNRLRELPAKTFKALSSLKKLDLALNNLGESRAEAWIGLKLNSWQVAVNSWQSAVTTLLHILCAMQSQSQ